MPKTKSQKEEAVKKTAENLKKAKLVILADFKGLKVKEITALRRELKQNRADASVVKKTLMDFAMKEAGLDFNAKESAGHIIGLSYGWEDNPAPAKILVNFAKSHEALKILGGFLENKFVEAGQIKILASLPGREELLAKAVGAIQAPLAGLVNILAGNLRGLVQVVAAYKEKKAAIVVNS